MDGLHSGAVYEELVSVRLVGMMLIIVVKQELRKNVIRYATQTVGTGALSFMVIAFFYNQLEKINFFSKHYSKIRL